MKVTIEGLETTQCTPTRMQIPLSSATCKHNILRAIRIYQIRLHHLQKFCSGRSLIEQRSHTITINQITHHLGLHIATSRTVENVGHVCSLWFVLFEHRTKLISDQHSRDFQTGFIHSEWPASMTRAQDGSGNRRDFTETFD
jgi:hypothetical protein